MHLYKTNKKQARGENQEFCCVQEYVAHIYGDVKLTETQVWSLGIG